MKTIRNIFLGLLLFGMIGKASEMLYAPVGAALSGLGKALELVFAPIGAVLGMIAGAKR